MPLFTIIQLSIIAAFVILTAIPLTRILDRAGFSGWWCVLIYIPILNLVGLWMFAFAEWPAFDHRSE